MTVTGDSVLDGALVMPKSATEDGFVAPEINSFGNTFRWTKISCLFSHSRFAYHSSSDPELIGSEFRNIIAIEVRKLSLPVCVIYRDYDAETERQKTVEEFYRLQHTNQTYDFVSEDSLAPSSN